MTTIYLEAFKDDETGTLGLGIVGAPRHEGMNAATEGLLIAHDLIEHQNGLAAIGGIDDELEALGAIWYVRGQHGELTRDGSGSRFTVYENIASDVVRMFRDYAMGAYVAAQPRSGKVSHDDDLQQILTDADETWRGEVDGEDEYIRSRHGVNTAQLWSAYRGIALARMRIGYAKARRRWERRGRHAANNRFWQIAEAVQPHCQPEYEGQRFKLTYDLLGANCEEDYGDE